MRAVLKDHVILFVPESDEEREAVADYVRSNSGSVFELRTPNSALALAKLGRKPDACREPIDIANLVANAAWRPIGNSALTPFVLDGRRYASVEAFWQGLAFPKESDRSRIAELFGDAAISVSNGMEPPASFVYGGAEIVTSSATHWALMSRACSAKFSQHAPAEAALLSTNDRPLEHRIHHESRTIPGVVMADIWMRIRLQLRAANYARSGGATW